MIDAAFVVPGDLAAATGGDAYARKIFAELPELQHIELPSTFPFPSRDDLTETARLLAQARGRVLLIDGLAFGAFTEEVLSRIDRPVVALVHHPLGLETGLKEEQAKDLLVLERGALSRAAMVVTTSTATAQIVRELFEVPPDKLVVAEPGSDPAPRSVSRSVAPVRLLSVGAVSERKAYDLLVSALADLTSLQWHLTIAGSTNRNAEAAGELKRLISEAGLTERVTLSGAVSDRELARFYSTADLVVSASLYEGYGMVLSEALARGLPIVASTGGAAGATVPEGAGLKVAPGDVNGLRGALSRMIRDPILRQRCAQRSWEAGQKLPRWSETAARIRAVLELVQT